MHRFPFFPSFPWHPFTAGHRGRYGHEFIEFEFRPDGKLRYANNSNYKDEVMIRKEAFVSQSVLDEVRRIVQESQVLQSDDKDWPEPDKNGRQELEIVSGEEHISFAVRCYCFQCSIVPSCLVIDLFSLALLLAYIETDIQDRYPFADSRNKRPGRTELILLFGPGFEMLGLLAHVNALQD